MENSQVSERVANASADLYRDITMIHGYRFDRMAFHEIVYDCYDRYVGQQQENVLSQDLWGMNASYFYWISDDFLMPEAQPS